jgi:hypothetical protein
MSDAIYIHMSRMGGIRRFQSRASLCACVVIVLSVTGFACRGDDTNDVREQLRLLQQQNQQLQEQLNKQQQMIDSLSRKVSEVDTASQARATELQSQLAAQPVAATPAAKPFSLGKIILSGEGGLAFFETGSEGQFPNAEFRIDEARLFLDAPVWDDTYFFTELDLITRENPNVNINVEELYVDFENVSRLWNQDRLLNVRVGRFNIPFGEEYQTRYAIDNPLIAHSLSDIWGVDEGLEVYGGLGKFDYVLAVQNGGANLDDFNADKAVAGRVGYNPTRWLRLSASGMRTGNINVQQDGDAALWLGNAQLSSIGSPSTTLFHSELAEGDVQLRMGRGQIKAAGGYLHYNDNDTAANNNRDVYYYYVQGQYDMTKKLYAAARFSQIIANGGFPLVGDGQYQYYGDDFTKNLWRLTLGAGYHFSPNLLLKVDYSFERGEESDGETRDNEDLFAAELAFQF